MTRKKATPPARKVTAKKFLGNGRRGPADVARTSSGLREALFQEIEALRSGKSDPPQAMAVAKLAQQIVNSVRVEIEFATRVKPVEGAPKVPNALRLVETGKEAA